MGQGKECFFERGTLQAEVLHRQPGLDEELIGAGRLVSRGRGYTQHSVGRGQYLPAVRFQHPAGFLQARRTHHQVRAAACLKLGQLALEEQLAALQNAQVAGYLFHLAQQMAGKEDGDAVLFRQRDDQLADFVDTGRVQAVGRLVQDKQDRIGHQRQGQRQALAHAQ